MTDTPIDTGPATTSVVETTDTNSNVSKPLVSPKPYDDDMMEAYAEQDAEAEAPKEGEPVGAPSTQVHTVETIDKAE